MPIQTDFVATLLSVTRFLKRHCFNRYVNDKKHLALKHEDQDQLREITEHGPCTLIGKGIERKPSAPWNVSKNYRNEIQAMSAVL